MRCSHAAPVTTRTDGLERRALVIGEQHEVARLDVTCGSTVLVWGNAAVHPGAAALGSHALQAARGAAARFGQPMLHQAPGSAPAEAARARCRMLRTWHCCSVRHTARMKLATCAPRDVSAAAASGAALLQPRQRAGSHQILLLPGQGGKQCSSAFQCPSSIARLSQWGRGGSTQSAWAGNARRCGTRRALCARCSGGGRCGAPAPPRGTAARDDRLMLTLC